MFAWMPSEREEVSSESIDLVTIIVKQKLCKLCQKKKKPTGLNAIAVGSENTWLLVLNSTTWAAHLPQGQLLVAVSLQTTKPYWKLLGTRQSFSGNMR